MSFQHPSQGTSTGGDVQNRRSILQGLQQTKNRLQRLHSDEPSASARLSPGHHMTAHRPVGRSPVHKATPSPVPITPSEMSVLHQQQKAAMQQALSQSFGYFVPQPSFNRNPILPVLPRFNANGELVN
ncbi:SOSS complex subunit C-like [Halichondria panicea]|uniref:SOSS complex subunit C-like n=1 Tax=Halichondria panicea TaxID=6063 RepID=UPI00312B9AB6